ncbi:Uncharacterised protein [Salmonella enterica subsp. enterica serovar Typhi]|nr:Uncharacterised protein [Salmonella enterica subsp. enterica serovar Typhi]
MREVEAQHFIANQRTFLRNVCPKHLAQRRVHQVRGGVVQTDTCAARFIYVSLYRIAHFQSARRQFAEVTNRLTIFLRVVHSESKSSAFQLAFIANLTA